jgi:transglutaminase-like putative cysteine protease
VQAICDWVHNNIEYRFGSGRPDLSASEVIFRRHGVCRDFAHAVIALCRAFNLSARYVTGHLPDIGAPGVAAHAFPRSFFQPGRLF